MNRKECLDAAAAAVLQNRQKTYGSPEDNFRAIGIVWEQILGVKVTPAQVAMCMAGLKLMRLRESPDHADSWVDLAGYAACGSEVASAKAAPLETKEEPKEEALPLPRAAKPTKCRAVQYGDRTGCIPCGLEWDTNDPEAPGCMWKLEPPQQKGFDPNAGTVCTHCGWTDGYHHVGCLATAKPGIT